MSGITGNKYSCIIFVYAGKNTDRNEYRHAGKQTDKTGELTHTGIQTYIPHIHPDIVQIDRWIDIDR
jgi:hypothetical protein